MAKRETLKSFLSRCAEASGMTTERVEECGLVEAGLPGQACLPGKSLCARRGVFFCAVGYPDDVDGDGNETWNSIPANFVFAGSEDDLEAFRKE